MTTLLKKRRRRQHLRQTTPLSNETKMKLSAAERYMRQCLRETKGINPNDDRAIHDYLASLRTTTEDHRSLWEKNVQARLARELGIA